MRNHTKKLLEYPPCSTYIVRSRFSDTLIAAPECDKFEQHPPLSIRPCERDEQKDGQRPRVLTPVQTSARALRGLSDAGSGSLCPCLVVLDVYELQGERYGFFDLCGSPLYQKIFYPALFRKQRRDFTLQPSLAFYMLQTPSLDSCVYQTNTVIILDSQSETGNLRRNSWMQGTPLVKNSCKSVLYFETNAADVQTDRQTHRHDQSHNPHGGDFYYTSSFVPSSLV